MGNGIKLAILSLSIAALILLIRFIAFGNSTFDIRFHECYPDISLKEREKDAENGVMKDNIKQEIRAHAGNIIDDVNASPVSSCATIPRIPMFSI